MRLLVAGDGAVARALTSAFAARDLAVGRWTRHQTPPGPAYEAAIIAVTDRAIGEVALRLVDEGLLAAHSVVLHCAGAVPPGEAFAAIAGRVAGCGLLHPLRALVGGADETSFDEVVFGVAGDAPAMKLAAELAARLGGVPLPLEPGQLAIYHAAAVLAGNHTLALVDAGVTLLGQLGLDPRLAARALSSLLASVAHNLAAHGAAAALSGPIARGEVEVIARHLAALSGPARDLYLATASATVELARRAGRAAPARLEAIARLVADAEGD